MGGSMIPKYTGVWNRGSIWRGDTLLGFAMRIVVKGADVAVVPTEVCAHIVDHFGRKVAELESSIGTDGTVTFARVEGAVTATWRAGSYAFDVEYTRSDGVNRTYLVGSLTVLEDK